MVKVFCISEALVKSASSVQIYKQNQCLLYYNENLYETAVNTIYVYVSSINDNRTTDRELIISNEPRQSSSVYTVYIYVQ